MNQFFYNLLQVETLHDFEAANSDELTLQRGDVVLVVPSDSEADQVKDKGRKHHRLSWFFLRVRWTQWRPEDVSTFCPEDVSTFWLAPWVLCCSAVSDSAAPWTVTRQSPLSIKFSRQEYWRGLPFPSSGDLPDPRIELGSPSLQADSLTSEHPGKQCTLA